MRSCNLSSPKSYLLFFYLLFSCFSFVSFRLNSLDTQIWHMVPGLMVIFIFAGAALKYKNLPELLLVLVSFLLLFISDFNFISFRSFASYLSFTVVVVATFVLIKKTERSLWVFLMVAFNYIYLIAGFLQLFLGPYSLDFIAPVRTTLDRGMTSLAVEPTYFALVLILFSWIFILLSDYKPSLFIKVLLFVNLIFIFFVAKSSMGVLYVFIASSLVFISKVRLKSILMVIIGVLTFSMIIVFTEILEGSRLGSILDYVFSQGIVGLAYNDASINSRLSGFFYPIFLFFDNLIIPHGYNNYLEGSIKAHNFFGGYFWYGDISEKIMSFSGVFIYELGFLGLAYLGSLAYRIIKYNGSFSVIVRVFEVFFIMLLSFAAIPVAMPLFAIVISILMYRNMFEFEGHKV